MFLLKPEEFAHLHTHYSSGSVLDGFCLPDRTMEHVKSIGQTAIAITDHGSLTSIPTVVDAARSSGVTPIIGVEFYMCDDMFNESEDGSDRDHLTVWIKNLEGFDNLKRIVNLGWLQGWNKRPRIDFKHLSQYGDGLVIASGCALSELSKALIDGKHKEAKEIAQRYHDRWGDDYYLEIMLTDFAPQVKVNKGILQLHRELGIKVIITNDAHYVKAEDAKPHDMLLCVNTKNDYDDPTRWRFDSNEYFIKDVEMLQQARDRWHPYIPDKVFVEACRNTLEVVDKCGHVGAKDLEFGKFKLPKFQIPEDYPGYKDWLLKNNKENETKNFLEYLCVAGWRNRRINEVVAGDPEKRRVYIERVRRELDDIDFLGYNDYFLIAWDINHWARDNCIPVGYGRGSGVGSLVAYLTGITNVDPIIYKLKWERFLNRTRGKKSPPDFDLDFSKQNRERIVGRLKEKYGEGSVASICNVVTMGPRTALRDVGARLKYPFGAMTEITEMFDDGESFQRAFERNPELAIKADEHPVLFEFARALEGQTKTLSVHASGKAIFPGPAIDHVPLKWDTNAKDAENRELVTMWDGASLEMMGYLKLDVLGLRTLDVIWDALADIAEMRVRQQNCTIRWNGNDMIVNPGIIEPVIDWRGINKIRLEQLIENGLFIDIDNLNWEDKSIFQEFSQGNTAMTFQTEGHAAMICCVAAKPKSIEDLTAINSLCRPGPRDAGSLEPYCDRSSGKERVTYLHPSFKAALGDTYGVILYQEQVMGLGEILGLTPDEADELRVAMKKKSLGKIEKHLKTMHETATVKLGLTEEQWEDLKGKLITFSAYGFNKCISRDTIIYRSSDNQYKGKDLTIGEAYDIWNDSKNNSTTQKWHDPKRGLSILAMSNDGQVRPARVKDIVYSGKKEVYKVTTRSGKIIKSTMDHHFYTSLGWKRLGEVSVGDFLIVTDFERKINPGFVNEAESERRHSRQIMLDNVKYCQICGNAHDRFEVHHIDGDRANNDLENLVVTCPSCHKKEQYQMGRKRKWDRGYNTFSDEIVSIEYAEIEDTYDIEMDSLEHNFIANGIVTHNSHACAYSFIGFQTMWLKIYHPYHYIASVLTSMIEESNSNLEDKFALYMRECLRLKISLLQPDINTSTGRFSVVYNEKHQPIAIRWSLSFIKGIGDKAVQSIVEARESGPFASYLDFYNRINRTRVNSGTREKLIIAGAFDAFGDRAEILKQEREINKTDLDKEIKLSKDRIITVKQIVPEKYFELEKILMLHTFSPTRLDQHSGWREKNDGIFWNQLSLVKDGLKVVILGQIMKVREHQTAKGKMAFVAVNDGYETSDMTVFYEPYEESKSKLKVGNIVLIKGTRSTYKGKAGLALSKKDGYAIKVIEEIGART